MLYLPKRDAAQKAARYQIKTVLQIVLYHLENLEEAGYLSPRIWGTLLLVGLFALFIWAQYRNPDSGMIQTLAQGLSGQTAPDEAVGPDEGSVGEAELEALPLQSVPTATPAPLPTATPPFVLHTVQVDETLVAIAAQYHLSSEDLIVANDIRDPTALEPGQQLLIPAEAGVRIPTVLHQVQSDDTLLSIAIRYGSSVRDIRRANPKLTPEDLPVGETVIVPVVFSRPRPSAMVDDEEYAYYTVQSGDVPLMIAAQFDIPVEVLLAANDIPDPTRLQVGQELVIPPHEGISLGFPVVLHEWMEGDTLLSLAIKYGSSVKDILAVNPDLSPSSLEPGQIVAVPIVFYRPRPTPEPNVVPPEPVEPSGPQFDLQEQMLVAINAERANRGLPPYELDEQAAQVALAHAQDMVARDYLSHVTPEGKTIRDRVEEGGILNAFRVGENIQVNTRPRDQTVEQALNWFMNSPPHRRGILHEYYNRVGIGIVNGPPTWHTFVLVFVER